MNFPYTYSASRKDKEAQLNQYGMTYWFTGLSGSGKSTVANAIEQSLMASGRVVKVIDADNVRADIKRSLSFDKQTRMEDMRLLATVCKLFNDAGIIVLATFISPHEDERNVVKETIGSYRLIYCSTPIEECERRDVKGLYKKARNNEISNFIGISYPYEPPNNPDLILDTSKLDIQGCVDKFNKECFVNWHV